MSIKDFYKSFRSLWGVASVLAAAGPMAFWPLDFDPPWPPQARAITVLFSAVGYIVAFVAVNEYLPNPNERVRKNAGSRRYPIAVGVGCIAVSVLCSFFYYSSYSTFVKEKPRTVQGQQQTIRRVIGSERKPGLADREEPDDKVLLANHNYDPDEAWTSTSLRSARLQVFLSFLIMFFLLTLGLGTLAQVSSIERRR